MVNGSTAALKLATASRPQAGTALQPRAFATDRGKLQDSIVEYYEAEVFSGRLPIGTRHPHYP
jgi:hypothetical protein